VTGTYIIILDGVPQVHGHQPVVVRQPATVSLTINGHECEISIDGTKSLFSYAYKLTVDGIAQPELRELADSGLNERIPRKIKSLGAALVGDLAYYRYEIDLGNGETVSISRRFSQFAMLDQLIKAQTPEHLLSSLPSLPGKVYNPYFDQTSKPFLDERQRGLTMYLNTLLGNHKVNCTADFLSFLGLHPVTGEKPRKGVTPEAAAAAEVATSLLNSSPSSPTKDPFDATARFDAPSPTAINANEDRSSLDETMNGDEGEVVVESI
jgi:hypothetical protein